jgi:hypothetical protein
MHSLPGPTVTEQEMADLECLRAERIAFLESLGLNVLPRLDVEYLRRLAAWDRMVRDHYRPARLWRRGEAA